MESPKRWGWGKLNWHFSAVQLAFVQRDSKPVTLDCANRADIELTRVSTQQTLVRHIAHKNIVDSTTLLFIHFQFIIRMVKITRSLAIT